MNPMLIHLPEPLAAMPGAFHETYFLHHMQMLSDSLTSDVRAGGELGDGHRAANAKAGDKSQAVLVTQCRE
jgi:hypothetical protein